VVDAAVLRIAAKRRAAPFTPTAARDFDLAPDGTLPAERILDDATLSPYCVDPERRALLFVRTPPQVDLGDVPFVYSAQYERATEVVAVPYETAFALAESAAFDASKLVLVYSVGRCGSTFVSAALRTVAGAVSFSEPDAYFAIEALQGAGDPDVERLVHACTVLLCAPRPASIWALKPRSNGIELASSFRAGFPAAKRVFLYRDGEDWARSAARAFRLFGPGVEEEWDTGSDDFPRLRTLADPDEPEPFRGPIDLLAWLWASPMLRALDPATGGFDAVLRYEELRADPARALSLLLRTLGLEPDAEALAEVAARDAQEGTYVSRARAEASTSELTPERHAAFLARLAEIAPGLAPDVVVPGTLLVAD
jgi:hypothetical protein